jgi:uncharacterized membrane protein
MSLLLFLMSLFCFLLSIFRIVYTESKVFLFLNWNLFLAFLPWLFSSSLALKPNLKKNKIMISLLLLIWLLFFPNAPYILTDLFHLKSRTSMPIWFDLVLILAFAWTGLMFGYLSLFDIQEYLQNYFPKPLVYFFSFIFIFLGSFGIYLGRFLRWNSWDIIRDPFGLFLDVSNRFLYPADHPKTWGVTFLMTILLSMIYASLQLLRQEKKT